MRKSRPQNYPPTVLAVDCPFCGRTTGEKCRTLGGSLRNSRPHKARRAAVERK